MSGKQGGGGGSGYDPNNKMHQESYWEGRPDPRDRADDGIQFSILIFQNLKSRLQTFF